MPRCIFSFCLCFSLITSCRETPIAPSPIDIGFVGPLDPLFSSCSPTLSTPSFFVAPQGNDNNSGSQSRPWKTISHAIQQVPDGSTILVQPGTYREEVRLDRSFPQGITVRSQVPYAAKLQNNGTVLVAFFGQGITLEGFDISHQANTKNPLLVHIQDLLGTPNDTQHVERITLRNNIIHDALLGSLVKVQNQARQIRIEHNLFFNQGPQGAHVEVNSASDVIIQDNIFFNDFEGSQRQNLQNTSAFVLVHDSNAALDGLLGSRRLTLRRNLFLHWQGDPSAAMLLLGQNGENYYEVVDAIVENNLFLGDSDNPLRAAWTSKSAKNVIFRNNTLHGDLPGQAFMLRAKREGSSPTNDNLTIYQNIFSDPTGTMGRLSETNSSDLERFEVLRNLYHNGNFAIPENVSDLINASADPEAREGSPRLAALQDITLPRRNPSTGLFAGSSQTICEVFENLVRTYGEPSAGSPAATIGNPRIAPNHDMLGRQRNEEETALGAVEVE
jgi:hypothetical protein